MVVSSETPLIDLAISPNQPFGFSLSSRLDQRVEDLFFLRRMLVEEGGVAAFGAHAEMDEQRGVAAVIEDHVGDAAAVPIEQLGGVVPVFGERLALDREDRNAGRGDRGGA